MIYDKLENIGKYNPNLQFISDTLQKSSFIAGKFDINDPQCFGIGLEYQTKPAEEALWEAHRKYLDIHVIISGEEFVQVSDISNMHADNEYEHDYQLFNGIHEHVIHLKEGCFLVLFPNEVHKTSIKVQESASVKKIVFKLLLDSF